MQREPTREVVLPERVVTAVEERLPHTEFESVGAYVTFVMEEVLVQVDGDDNPTVDHRGVESRLESLGYLD